MAVNIFEGGRRITHVLAVLLVLAVGIWVLRTMPEPWAIISIELKRPGSTGQLVEKCSESSAVYYKQKEINRTGSGFYDANLCFPAIANERGVDYIPIRLNSDGTYLSYPRYSNEVSQYTKDVGEAYRTPPDIEKVAETRWLASRNELWKHNSLVWLLFSGIYLAMLYGIAWVIGWVVRGFVGVPRGRDAAPAPAPVKDK